MIHMTNNCFLLFAREILSYTDGNAPLTETDLEKIAKTKSMKLIKEKNNLMKMRKKAHLMHETINDNILRQKQRET